MKTRRVGQTVVLALALGVGMFASPSAAAPDIVLYASDVAALRGNWVRTASSGAAGAQILSTSDNGWSTANAPLAAPSYFVEATFNASAATPYHVWLRLRATANSKYNDSVWVQLTMRPTSTGPRSTAFLRPARCSSTSRTAAGAASQGGA